MQNISTSQAIKISLISRSSYFAGLSDDYLSVLASGTHLRGYGRGEIVCWQGETCPGLFIIQSGSVKLFKLSTKGRELILRVLEEGASFNEVPVFDQQSNAVNVAALEDSEIWMVEADVIRQAIRNNPDLAQVVIANLANNLRLLVGMIEELSFHQVTTRLARLIFQLSPEQLEGPVAQRITQEQLAARLGSVREVVARSLRDLERSGAIRVTRRQIQVVNQTILRDWFQESID